MKVYRALAYVIAAEVIVQASAIAFAMFGLGHWIDQGGVADKAALEDGDVSFLGLAGFSLHWVNGMLVIPLLALAFLVCSVFVRSMPGAVRWALVVLGLVIVQVTLGLAAHEVVALGPLHGLNAFALLGCAVYAGRRVGSSVRPGASTAQPDLRGQYGPDARTAWTPSTPSAPSTPATPVTPSGGAGSELMSVGDPSPPKGSAVGQTLARVPAATHAAVLRLRALRGWRRVAAITAGAVLAVASIAGVAVAAFHPGSGTDEADRLRSLERAELRALVTGDGAAMRRVLDPHVTLITPDGAQLSRDDYIAAVSGGDIDFRVFEPVSELVVRQDHDDAVVTFESNIDAIAGGQHYAHRAWHTEVFHKTDGAWRLVWAQTTAVGGFPPAAR